MGATIEIKAGYKETNLGWIPKEWELSSFKNISKINQGLQIAISERYTSNVPDSHFYITNEFLKIGAKSQYYILNPNESVLCNKEDILMTRTGNTGQVVTNVEGAFHNNFFKIKFQRNILNKDYFYYYLTSTPVQKTILIYAGTSTIPDLNHSDFYRILIPLPPLPEQKKIADILSTWDKAIETTQALIKKLQLRKKGLMQQLLTGKKRLPGFSGEWEVVQFKDIIKERSEYPDGDLPLYSLTIQDGVTPKTERYERSFLLTTTVKAYKKMCTNDFALNPMNLRFGAIAKHSGDLDVCVSKYYNIFYCLDDFNSTYFEYYLQSNPMIQYYNKMAIGSLEEKKRVHFSDFIKFKKQLPSFKEQTAIAQVLTKTDDGINQTQNYLEQLQKQKKGLMQQLLTGQKRVKV